MASVVNLAIDQGATFLATVNATDDYGNPRNLANCSVRSQMRKTYYTHANVEFYASVTDPANGEITMSLTHAETSNIKHGRYVYDLEMINADFSKERVIEGIVTVYPEVTR